MQYWVSAVFVEADQLVPLAVRADELGFAGLSLPDHGVMPEHIESAYPGGTIPWQPASHWPDVWVMIGAMSSVTTRLRFVTNVYVLPLRHPLVVARSLNTASAVSGGRVVLGVGVGWMAEEFAALGQDFATRGARTDAALGVLRAVGTGGPAHHDGPEFEFPTLHVQPAPLTPAPIWVGGESTAALRRAAALADGWITEHPAHSVSHLLPELARLRVEAGRSDEHFDIAVAAWSPPDESDVADFRRWGIDHVKVQPWTFYGGDPTLLDTKLAALDRFAADHLAAP